MVIFDFYCLFIHRSFITEFVCVFLFMHISISSLIHSFSSFLMHSLSIYQSIFNPICIFDFGFCIISSQTQPEIQRIQCRLLTYEVSRTASNLVRRIASAVDCTVSEQKRSSVRLSRKDEFFECCRDR